MIFALGGITPPAPAAPYPKREGMKITALSPKDKCSSPSMKPGIIPSFFPA